jgi:GntR family carbon starvation induced transcriptional regulator
MADAPRQTSSARTAGCGDATLAARAEAAIRAAIVSGEFMPGSALRIPALERRLAIGATPLREGLSRLARTGWVVSIGQRGFQVSGASLADLADITRLRRIVEPEALRLSLAAGDDRWEGEVVAALHRLLRCVARGQGGLQEGSETLDRAHRDFHAALIAACGSPRTIALCHDLYDQAYRYRRVTVLGPLVPDDFEAEHRRLAELALARDAEGAAARLHRHLGLTLDKVRAATGRIQHKGEDA